MPDMEDDWMNPSRTTVWKSPPPPKFGDIDYVILRKRAIPVTGNVAAIYRWDRWGTYKTAEERDRELERLQKEHPLWRLKAKNINAYYEYHHMPQPGDDD